MSAPEAVRMSPIVSSEDSEAEAPAPSTYVSMAAAEQEMGTRHFQRGSAEA